MLILTRRIGETINISDDIEVTVLGIRGHQVRLGVNAPADVRINRKEIHLRIMKEKEMNAADVAGASDVGNAVDSNENTDADDNE